MSIEEAKEAATRLAKNEEDVATYTLMNEVTSKFPNKGLRFSGDRAWINPIMRTLEQDPEVYKVIVQWVNNKRISRGLTPLITDDEKFDKGVYQREFMAEKRLRERRIVQIVNSRRPAKDALKGVERIEFVRDWAKQIKERRDKMIEAARGDANRRLSKQEMQTLVEAFWNRIDSELDAMERER